MSGDALEDDFDLESLPDLKRSYSDIDDTESLSGNVEPDTSDVDDKLPIEETPVREPPKKVKKGAM
jgi:hypothetical protein